MPLYNSIEEMIVATAEAVRPPERITVSEAAERYHIVKNPGQHEGPFSLDKTPYLREPMDVLTSLDHTGMVFVGPARTGKALALDTPIATPTGWSTMGDLCIGDQVFDERGEPCAVTFTTGVMYNHDCYRVVFDDGSEIVADAGHKWKVDDIWGSAKTLTTEALFYSYAITQKSGAIRYRYSIPTTSPIFGRFNFGLRLDPYLLGVWLGDGSTSIGKLTLNDWDIDHILSEIEPSGFKSCRRVHYPAKSSSEVTLKSRDETLHIALRSMGLIGNKHIPEIYLRSCEYQRRRLLQGLMDTDGSASAKRSVLEWSTSYPKLLVGMCELLASLGIKFTVTSRIPKFRGSNGEKCEGSRSYRVCFTPDDAADVFTLPRQIETWRNARSKSKPKTGQTKRRWIRSIEPVDSVPVKCITVDSPSHLFLAGRNMIPTHNSSMAINWLCHTAITDPADMMIVHMAQHTARDWSQADLAKALRNSPELKKRLLPGRQNDNVFDKHFLSGMRLLVTWPTINNLSGKTIPRLWLMDYDRQPQDIDGEGNPYDLAKKRSQTFRRYGMTVAEASPGYDIEDPKWMAKTPHEAPPTRGILALYNRGDRRRWYWACPECESAFEPHFKLLQYPSIDSKDIMEVAEQTVMVCPHCGGYMEPRQQRELNRGGRWVKEGQVWTPATDTVEGTPRRSDTASFWMFGPAAGFTDWPELVKKYLNALHDYEATGDEGPLTTTVNVDQGDAYLPKVLEGGRLPETLQARAEDWGGHDENGDPFVPERVRFLVATVDVQAGGRPCFVVHIFGIAEGNDVYHVDMFKITKSVRLNEDGEREHLDPAAFVEDWDLLVSQVMEKSYPLNDCSGRRMAVKIVACDSGGADGVTANAYDFYRKLTAQGRAGRFHLVKGSPSRSETAPIRVTWPNSQQKDRFTIARGDVPVWLVNSNIVKDQVSNMLGRDEPGGQVHFPKWAEPWLYSQLTTEIRDPVKGWINPSRRRNEAFDLLAYCVAICDHPDIRIRFIDWSNPPEWAGPWNTNPLVFGGDEEAPQIESRKERKSLAELGAELG